MKMIFRNHHHIIHTTGTADTDDCQDSIESRTFGLDPEDKKVFVGSLKLFLI